MSEEAKTYVFGNDSNSMLPFLANNMNGCGGGAWWIIIFLAVLWGRGGFGNGQDLGALMSQFANGQTSNLAMDAINGNTAAINQLASTLNCDVNSVQAAINSINTSICQVGNQVGMSGLQIQNAVSQGNAAVISKLQECCCENKLMITEQGYQNRIASAEQTAILGGKIDQQTALINDKFCSLEMREMQNKIDSLREINTSLKGQIDNANQTAAITAYVNSLITPLTTTVNEIKAATPNTVTVPWPQLTAVPTNYLCGYNNGSIWS